MRKVVVETTVKKWEAEYENSTITQAAIHIAQRLVNTFWLQMLHNMATMDYVKAIWRKRHIWKACTVYIHPSLTESSDGFLIPVHQVDVFFTQKVGKFTTAATNVQYFSILLNEACREAKGCLTALANHRPIPTSLEKSQNSSHFLNPIHSANPQYMRHFVGMVRWSPHLALGYSAFHTQAQCEKSTHFSWSGLMLPFIQPLSHVDLFTAEGSVHCQNC